MWFYQFIMLSRLFLTDVWQMVFCIFSSESTSTGFDVPLIISAVIMHFWALSLDGIYIVSMRSFSIIERSPWHLFYVQMSYVLLHVWHHPQIPSSTPSSSNNFLYCFVNAFFGSTRIFKQSIPHQEGHGYHRQTAYKFRNHAILG